MLLERDHWRAGGVESGAAPERRRGIPDRAGAIDLAGAVIDLTGVSRNEIAELPVNWSTPATSRIRRRYMEPIAFG